MRASTLSLVSVIAVLGLALAPGCSQESPRTGGLNSLSDMEKAQGWTLLFNGKDLKGWRVLGRQDSGRWVIDDGAIKKVLSAKAARNGQGRPGDLMTERAYLDFELVFEWKIEPGGNSGLKYNVSEEMSKRFGQRSAAIGFEYQVLDDERFPDLADEPPRLCAALYDIWAPEGRSLRPAGEFNASRVMFRGSHGEHWLNGVKVLEYDLVSSQFGQRLAASKFRDIAGFAQKRRGHIVLQDEAGAVWYRNLKIRELKGD